MQMVPKDNRGIELLGKTFEIMFDVFAMVMRTC